MVLPTEVPIVPSAVVMLPENVIKAAAIATATMPTRIAYSSADTASLARRKRRNRREMCFVFFASIVFIAKLPVAVVKENLPAFRAGAVSVEFPVQSNSLGRASRSSPVPGRGWPRRLRMRSPGPARRRFGFVRARASRTKRRTASSGRSPHGSCARGRCKGRSCHLPGHFPGACVAGCADCGDGDRGVRSGPLRVDRLRRYLPVGFAGGQRVEAIDVAGDELAGEEALASQAGTDLGDDENLVIRHCAREIIGQVRGSALGDVASALGSEARP